MEIVAHGSHKIREMWSSLQVPANPTQIFGVKIIFFILICFKNNRNQAVEECAVKSMKWKRGFCHVFDKSQVTCSI